MPLDEVKTIEVKAICDGMRELANWLEDHPQIHPYIDTYMSKHDKKTVTRPAIHRDEETIEEDIVEYDCPPSLLAD